MSPRNAVSIGDLRSQPSTSMGTTPGGRGTFPKPGLGWGFARARQARQLPCNARGRRVAGSSRVLVRIRATRSALHARRDPAQKVGEGRAFRRAERREQVPLFVPTASIAACRAARPRPERNRARSPESPARTSTAWCGAGSGRGLRRDAVKPAVHEIGTEWARHRARLGAGRGQACLVSQKILSISATSSSSFCPVAGSFEPFAPAAPACLTASLNSVCSWGYFSKCGALK